ncbi:hypothetical protein DYY67_0006 [Candidatus Nitrosotalea sp. TS]|nr:hypothetical protein [Candidatus Nitrosotalea sp. TS]
MWAGGVIVDPLISSLKCEHGGSGRVVVDQLSQTQRISQHICAWRLCTFDRSSQ